MKFYKIELSAGEHLPADRKTKPLRFENGFHCSLTEGPVSVSVSRKHRRFDFFLVSFTDKNSHGSYLLLAPRLWKLLEAAGATGYFLRETDVKLGFEHEPWERDYRQMVITGWGGVAKGIHRVESYRGKQCYTLPDDLRNFFDFNQWDGTDFFDIWPACGFYVTERIANIIKEEKIKGLHLRSLETVSFTPVDEKVGLIGHPLRSLFPEDRARDIGEPLGIYWWEEEKREA